MHSPEPWNRTPGIGIVAMLDDLKGPPRTISIYCDSFADKVHHIAAGVSEEDAQRIVACVNACAGIPDPAEYMKLAKSIIQE